mmetsp:Transcript_1864/g.4073  ORF Transcript_1864/g.4073 Transcript_1864/m.4073 type:complete len:308 (+) Transcript_1864:1512-2435(+)
MIHQPNSAHPPATSCLPAWLPHLRFLFLALPFLRVILVQFLFRQRSLRPVIQPPHLFLQRSVLGGVLQLRIGGPLGHVRPLSFEGLPLCRQGRDVPRVVAVNKGGPRHQAGLLVVARLVGHGSVGLVTARLDGHTRSLLAKSVLKLTPFSRHFCHEWPLLPPPVRGPRSVINHDGLEALRQIIHADAGKGIVWRDVSPLGSLLGGWDVRQLAYLGHRLIPFVPGWGALMRRDHNPARWPEEDRCLRSPIHLCVHDALPPPHVLVHKPRRVSEEAVKAHPRQGAVLCRLIHHPLAARNHPFARAGDGV